MREKDFEDILEKYPDLIEPGLKPIGRQIVIYNRRMDLLYEDRHHNRLIVELKVGPIKDEHLGQILAYEGMILSADDPAVRVMLIGTRVPPNIQKTLDHHGIAWREFKITQLMEYLKSVDDSELLSRITEEIDHLSYLKKSTDRQPNRAKQTPSVNPTFTTKEIDEFACQHCTLSLRKLREMAELGGTKEVFTTPARCRPMNIYEVIEDDSITMRRSTGKITPWSLSINTLRHIHDLVHAGEIDLNASEIDSVRIDGVKKAATWGVYIAALLMHLGCSRISDAGDI